MRKTIVFLLLTTLLLGCAEMDRYIRVTGYAQGGTYTVTCNLRGVSVPPAEIHDSIESILHLIDTTLSGYNKGSLLSRFNAGEPVRPNGLFLDMYRVSYGWFVRSGGCLDFAAGPLYDAWGFGFKSGEMPSDEAVKEIVASCGMKHLPDSLPVVDGMVDPAALGFPKLNYNAIAQGYSCDLVAAYLYGIGVKDMLVDIGEIYCDGLNPSGKPWSVGVDRPLDGNDTPGEDLDGIWLSDGGPRGVVTSGNYRKFYIRDGKKYSHTIDPLSGYPVSHNLLSATIAAPDAASADALATWCMVIGLDASKDLILSDDSIEGYLISSSADGLEGSSESGTLSGDGLKAGSLSEWSSPGFSLRQ